MPIKPQTTLSIGLCVLLAAMEADRPWRGAARHRDGDRL